MNTSEDAATAPALWMPPGHFYSPIPSARDVAELAARKVTATEEIAGIDLRPDAQLDLLREFVGFYAEQPFSPQRQPGLRFYFENDQFSYSDAIFLYCMLRHTKPRRIIEVGCGFSSGVILDTNERFLIGMVDHLCIDPFPDSLRSVIGDRNDDDVRVLARRVQEVDIEEFLQLGSGDILFIDSTHVTKLGSDVNFLVFEVLPRLARGVLVHFHDVFFPFEYPLEWAREGRAWNEAYLLRAFLQFNREFEIVLFNHFLSVRYPEVIERDFPLCTRNPGGSLWLRALPGG